MKLSCCDFLPLYAKIDFTFARKFFTLYICFDGNYFLEFFFLHFPLFGYMENKSIPNLFSGEWKAHILRGRKRFPFFIPENIFQAVAYRARFSQLSLSPLSREYAATMSDRLVLRVIDDSLQWAFLFIRVDPPIFVSRFDFYFISLSHLSFWFLFLKQDVRYRSNR